MWGEDGFLKHTEAVQEFYLKQREAMLEAAEKHLTGMLPLKDGYLLMYPCLFYLENIKK